MTWVANSSIERSHFTSFARVRVVAAEHQQGAESARELELFAVAGIVILRPSTLPHYFYAVRPSAMTGRGSIRLLPVTEMQRGRAVEDRRWAVRRLLVQERSDAGLRVGDAGSVDRRAARTDSRIPSRSARSGSRRARRCRSAIVSTSSSTGSPGVSGHGSSWVWYG